MQKLIFFMQGLANHRNMVINKPFITAFNTSKTISKKDLSEREKTAIINRIERNFKVKVKSAWLPAEGIEPKSMLLLTLENQEELLSKNENLGLDIYLFFEKEANKYQTISSVDIL